MQSGKVIDKKISIKKLAIYALKDGGTKEQEIEPEQQNRQALTDEQILSLTRKGRNVEEHFGCPQDIEWCLADATFYFVQSRPITSLGLSLFKLTTSRPMFIDGGRLFVDITHDLASSVSRKVLLNAVGEGTQALRNYGPCFPYRNLLRTL